MTREAVPPPPIGGPGRTAPVDAVPHVGDSAPGDPVDPAPRPAAGGASADAAGVRGAVITVSDRCSRGEAEDRSGPLAAALLAEVGVAAAVVVVPDGAESVRAAVRGALDDGARLVLTTGGTGVGPRDATPEGTRPLLARELPGVAEAIRARGAAAVPFAVLSRGLAGIAAGAAGEALVVNVPGSPGAVRDAVAVLAPLVPHVLDQLGGGAH
ncbi:molybdenum cofactor biosynthesis protein B [Georgenia sp. SYP-B2076]|uniref:MogA/MoaB family molybdenum cofactor biosynthesis protein n=1 Tax=Georgenia sp. SYP-B2076 TaxID=2495881 RepID=UPI00351339F2